MNAKDEFGWRSIFKVYTSKDILKDSLVPILLSISMIIIGNFSDIPSYKSLSTIIDLCIGIIPTIYNPQIQISAESETKRSIFREKDKTKRSKKESAQHSKSRNKSFVMTSVSAL